MSLKDVNLQKVIEQGLPFQVKALLKTLPPFVEDWINGVIQGAAQLEPWNEANRESYELSAHQAIGRIITGRQSDGQMLHDSMILAVGPLLAYLHKDAPK